MKKLSLFVFCCLLSACSLLGTDDPLPLYTLKSESFEPSDVLFFPLAIDVPLSEPSLNTPRIAVTPCPYQRDYMANGEWPDRLPKIFQEVLIQCLGQRWGGAYVNRMSAGLKTKYILRSEIQDFSVYYLDKNRPEVRLKIIFKLVSLRDRHVLSAHTFSETVYVSSPTMQGIVCAFNQGTHSLLVKAVSWMEEIFSKESLLNSRKDKLSGKSR